jgi:hypothetical protein
MTTQVRNISKAKPASVSEMTSLMGRLIGLIASHKIIHKKGDVHKTCYSLCSILFVADLL